MDVTKSHIVPILVLNVQRCAHSRRIISLLTNVGGDTHGDQCLREFTNNLPRIHVSSIARDGLYSHALLRRKRAGCGSSSNLSACLTLISSGRNESSFIDLTLNFPVASPANQQPNRDEPDGRSRCPSHVAGNTTPPQSTNGVRNAAGK
jgi:hypothetical protein